MNPRPRTVVAALFALLVSSAGATLVYTHDFTGGATTLNGVATTTGDGTWKSTDSIQANGVGVAQSGSAQGSAWLPYAFGSGIYTVTASINLSTLSGTGLAAISFTSNASPFDTGFVNNGNVESYPSFALRANKDFAFWAGKATANAVSAGSLAIGESTTGTLKLVLDTTGAAWTVNAFYATGGGSERAVDLNPADSGSVTYTYVTNPPTFTGIGIFSGTAGVDFDRFTFDAVTSAVPEPSSYALLTGGLALLGVVLRKRFI